MAAKAARRRFVFAGLAVLLLALSGERGEAGARWQCATTKHFSLFARADPESVTHMARNLERMADLLAQEGMGSTAPARPRVFLIAFPDRKSFKPHQPLHEGRRFDVAGYAVSSMYGHWIGYVEDELQGRWTANHEFVHTIAAELFDGVPLCLNEGFAEFYSTSVVSSGGVRYGHPIPWHRYVMKSFDLFSLDELFGKEARSLAHAGGRSSAVFYAESWGLVHYLMHQSGGAPRLRRFAERMTKDAEARRVMAEVYPEVSWESMPERLKSYVGVEEDDFPIFEIPLPGLPEQVAVSLREADPAEIGAHIGLWRMRADWADSLETLRLFDEASRSPVAAALAQDGRGVFALESHRPLDAVGDFRNAAADARAGALSLAIAGSGLLQVADANPASPDDSLAREALGILERSLDADSTDARALAAYGRSALLTGRVTPRAARALDRAAQALPTDPTLRQAAAAARERLDAAPSGGRLTDADAGTGAGPSEAADSDKDFESVMVRLRQREAQAPDEESRGYVRREIQMALDLHANNAAAKSYNRGIEAFRRRDFDAAEKEFIRARDGAADSALWVSANQRVLELPGFRAYQGGMDAVARNDLPAALAAFEKARPLVRGESMRAQCEKNIVELRALLAKRKPRSP